MPPALNDPSEPTGNTVGHAALKQEASCADLGGPAVV
jgi:hypothetical protein